MSLPLLKKAARLYQRKKFSAVVKLLEPQVFRYRNNFRYYYLLGLACLYENDISGAGSYLSRASQLDRESIDCRLALAALSFIKDDFDTCLKIWLEIIEDNPRNKTARRGLNFLRKDSQGKDLSDPRIVKRKLFPPLPRVIPVLRISLIFLFLAVIGFTAPIILQSLSSIRPELKDIEFPTGVLTEEQGDFTFSFTENDIKSIYRKARRYYNQYRENLALVEFNRLLHSNASEEIKSIAHMLKNNVRTPNFSTIRDSFSLAEIHENPLLYQDCYINWSGKIANLKVEPDYISFDFLVGYQKEEILEGIVPVFLDFAVILHNGNNVELLGLIEYSEQKLTLKGISIHRIK